MGRLDGKIAIVAGSATGIGAATSRLMAREGAKVVLADINIQRAEAGAAAIRTAGGEAFAWAMDIADESAVKAMVAETVARYGGVDVLHSNAAGIGRDASGVDGTCDVVDLDLAVWDRTMAVNVRGFLLCLRAAIPEMLKRGGGSIICTSSAAGLAAEPVRGAYATSKAAMIGLTRHVATAYGKRGIRCNAVAPGVTPNPDLGTPTDGVKRFNEIALRHHLTPRLGKPEDIANMVAFLASDDAGFVTGQVISVDGGILAHLPMFADLVELPDVLKHA